MDCLHIFEKDLAPLMEKHGFVLKNGIFVKCRGDIFMAFSCLRDSLSDITCAVFPLFTAKERKRISLTPVALVSDNSWVDLSRLSNLAAASLSDKIEGKESLGTVSDFTLGKIRMGAFILPELSEVRDFISYTEWLSGEYKMTERLFTQSELIYRSFLDSGFDYAKRYLLRLKTEGRLCEEEITARYSQLLMCMEKGCADISDYVKEETEKTRKIFQAAFPEAFA